MATFRRWHVALAWMGAIVGAATTLVVALPSQARLDPYYVVRGLSAGRMRPRVLFVLDTSGSMSWLQQSSPTLCKMASCEGTTSTTSSRIAAARQAIRKVIDETQDVADFSLMTFKQLAPPKASTELPQPCQSTNASGTLISHRFAWYDSYSDSYSSFSYAATLNGVTGRWRLCGENRPFPYLRWDNLGTGSVITADDRTTAVPASPLISMTAANFSGAANKTRKVQFFPRFMGVRINLNDTTDPGKKILAQTWGDYGNDTGNRNSKVWTQDFYYWPYVDGFPGYTYHNAYASGASVGSAGVAAWNELSYGASLHAPFYLAGASAKVGATNAGPLSDDEATNTVMGLSAPMAQGGVDVDGGTPWASTIGSTSVTPPADNRAFSHATVASYLKFVRSVSNSDLCVPQSAVLVTDGDPWPDTEGGPILHQRLADLRRTLETKVYVVGFVHTSSNLNNMACAAAGSTSTLSPCSGTSARKWDTCADPTHPTSKCAYVADDAEQLADTLTKIVTGDVVLDLPSGPSYQVNEFGIGAGGQQGSGSAMQTNIDARTEVPSWKGHVVRSACNWTDPEDPSKLDEACINKPFDEKQPTFGPCSASRSWDAGSCLAATRWQDRRIFINAANNSIARISSTDGKASSAFVTALNSSDLALVGRPFSQTQADAIAAFILGKDWPDGWKLPGLAQSAPMVVRRIPPKQPKSMPKVSIRDAHCAGRVLTGSPAVHLSLEAFADEAWAPSQLINPANPHHPYQEAVLVGDDLGVLHAFQLDSGNELWGFLPRTLLQNAVKQYAFGAASRGQPGDLDQHLYGLGGTVNLSWIWDAGANSGKGQWRHLAIVTAARGGAHLMALDVSHMSPESPEGPFEVLWTSSDPALAAQYSARLGATWSRPAVTYHVPDDEIETLPVPYLILGSGEPVEGATATDTRGQSLLWVNATTGQIVDAARLPAASGTTYGNGRAAVTDVAMGSHCVSRYWAEAQEAYVTDRAGRLYRWDLGRETSHASDSGGRWAGTAIPAASFTACQGTGLYSCTVGTSNRGEPFFYGAAVAGANRIDDIGGRSGVFPDQARDRFLIALVGGSLLDDAQSGNTTGADYHPSLFLLADDHRSSKSAGFNLPSGAPIAVPGSHASYMRIPISSIERTRVYTPFAGGTTYRETRKFSRLARPVRAPKISVTGLSQGTGESRTAVPGYEVYYIEYTIYEPSLGACDAAWHDPATGRWINDEGSTYVVRFRLIVSDEGVFDFISGAGSIGRRVGDTYGFASDGLAMAAPEQVRDGACADGICGPQPLAQKQRPCDPNGTQSAGTGTASVGMGVRELNNFSAVELPSEEL